MAGSFDRAAILESFLKELQTYIPEIEMNLDRLQRQPQNADALEEIYRRAHTIAGSAAMMDLNGMAQIAGGMETIVGDTLDGMSPLNEQVTALLRRSVMRLRQLMDLARTGADDSSIVAQDRAEYSAIRGRGITPSPLPRVMGGPGAQPPPQGQGSFSPPMRPPTTPFAASGWGTQPAASYGSQPFIEPQRGQMPMQAGRGSDYLPTMPLRDDLPPAAPVQLTRLVDTPLWQDVVADESSVQQAAGALLQSITALRELSHQVDGERQEMLAFLDGSRDALERLEQWAGQAMGIDLRTSPDHVRRYLPLSVLWVVTTRMKQFIERLQDSTRGLNVQQESLGDELGHLREALDRAGQIAGAAMGATNATANGGFTASVAQFSWTPPTSGNPATTNPSASSVGQLRPAERAEIERAVREELRRELEDDVRAEVASELRRDEERRMRQELEIQLRRQLLAELAPLAGSSASLSSELDMGALSLGRPASPRRVVVTDRSSETLDVFRGEAEEHLRAMTTGITNLEINPHDMEAIKSIRRAIHTLKGAAAITGFTAVADLSHICEDLLDGMADGSIAPTPDVISLILDTAQALDAMILGDTAEQGGEGGILAALRPRFQVLLGETVELSSPQQSVTTPTPQHSIVNVTDLTEHADDDIEPLEAGAEARVAAERADISDLSVRLPLRKLDDLITLFGDILVNRSVVEERMGRLVRMVGDSINVGDRLRDVGRHLEREFETALLPSQRQAPPSNSSPFGKALPPPPRLGGVMNGSQGVSQSADFDPIQMDRYSDFHLLSRGLTEGIDDATTLNAEIDATVREMEVALARESRLSSSFQDALLKARLVPISSLVPRLYRAIRVVATKYGKEFELLVEGEDTEMDRSVYEDVAAPLLHLMRNAIYHAVETPQVRETAGKPPVGQIMLSARYEGSQLVLSVRDDGNGISAENIRATAQARGLIDSYAQLDDRELINLIFQPGFSTSKEVTEEAGRGIGLDVVRDTVSRLRGTIEVDSVVGEGTTFTMKIPINLQIQRVVLVRVGNQTFALPMTVVEQLVQMDYFGRSLTSGVPALEVRGMTYPLVHLATYLNLTPGPVSDKTPVLLVTSGQQHWALIVDAVSGRQEIVAKNLGPHLRSVPWVPGATVLGNGQVVLILDPVEMLQKAPRAGAVLPTIPAPGTVAPVTNAHQTMPPSDPRVVLRPSDLAHNNRPAQPMGRGDPHAVPYILVVDDSPSVRRFVSATLKNAGWDVMAARDGAEALDVVAKRTPAAVLLDIEMPRMDGYELMAALREQPAYQSLPLIVLTSRAATKHQQRALQLGADAYVVKPYQDDQLLATLNELVPVRPDGTAR